MSENRKVRFTVLDAILLLVVLAAAFFIGMKIIAPAPADTEGRTYMLEFYAEEVPEGTAAEIHVGDTVTDASRGETLGRVASIEIGEAAVYQPDEEGVLQITGKEGYCSVKLTVETEGRAHEHGVKIGGALYVNGREMKLYAGGAELEGRISAITD